jgi:hypothetical protein
MTYFALGSADIGRFGVFDLFLAGQGDEHDDKEKKDRQQVWFSHRNLMNVKDITLALARIVKPYLVRNKPGETTYRFGFAVAQPIYSTGVKAKDV